MPDTNKEFSFDPSIGQLNQRPGRVLIISTTFFPDPQVGAIRITQWSRHLHAFGWQPMVFARQYFAAPTAEALAAEVHPSVRLQYLNDPPPSPPAGAAAPPSMLQSFKRNAVHVVAHWLVPDSGIVFWHSARRRALEYARAFEPDVVLSSSPAHSTHDLGHWLSRTLNVPWVADFRDVYLLDYKWRHDTIDRLNWLRHQSFERKLYANAAAVIHAIPTHARWARMRYPAARGKIFIIPNGFPVELMDPAIAAIPANQPERRAIRVIGSIVDEDALRLAAAVKKLIERGLDVEFCVLGRKPGNISKLVELLGERFVAPGYVPHRQAIGYVKGASLLISYLSLQRARSYQLTSKLFEFIASGTPTLEINPSRPDISLLRRYGVPFLQTPTSHQLAAQMEQMLAATGDRSAVLQQFRAEYGRQHQTGELARVLTSALRSPGRS